MALAAGEQSLKKELWGWQTVREVMLLTGNNGQQISAQVSPRPPEACLIQLEPR